MLKASTIIACCFVVCTLRAQAPDAGRRTFENNCSVCHGGDGMGGELGPPIVRRIARRTDEQLTSVIQNGVPRSGMPAFRFDEQKTREVIAYLRTLKPPTREVRKVRKQVDIAGGRKIEGLVLNESIVDLQMLTDDKRVHLLRKTGKQYREVTSQTDWTTYNGNAGGNRWTTLTQIKKDNLKHLGPAWTYTLETASSRVESTPLVIEGIMYVTNANECWALDAGSGRMIWHYSRPRTEGLVGNAAAGFNRGVAWSGDRLFMVTDNAHIISLNRFTGELGWETVMADWKQNYNSGSAPLVVNNLVLSGVAGGEQGARGFIAAFDCATGKEVWRFWTVPAPGEPGSETWKGSAIEHPSAATWFTGTYDPELDTVYWPTGNPGPDYNGDERGGDNLYSCSILALDAKTGKLKWYYQTTPHDVHDWDATEPTVLVNARWEGKPRKLLLQANRNGFFYVLDRETGKLLLAKPFVKKLNWASEIGRDGRPVLKELPRTKNGGTFVCPSQDGATNWFSTSWSEQTGFYYVQSLEKCNIYVKRPVEWQAGGGFLGGSPVPIPDEIPQKVLRAIDISTGKIAWELPQVGPAISWGGTLATASGLVFVGEDSGMLMAVDAESGEPLWRFQTNQTWTASPMTYVFDGKQYIAVAAGVHVMAFAVHE